jgi:hypothetical protein
MFQFFLILSKHTTHRLYCYAQKHVRSIRAVTKDPGEIAEKRYRSIRRLNKPNKKLKMKNLHHSSPYHVSDHKAAITVGVIMGVFLGENGIFFMHESVKKKLFLPSFVKNLTEIFISLKVN